MSLSRPGLFPTTGLLIGRATCLPGYLAPGFQSAAEYPIAFASSQAELSMRKNARRELVSPGVQVFSKRLLTGLVDVFVAV